MRAELAHHSLERALVVLEENRQLPVLLLQPLVLQHEVDVQPFQLRLKLLCIRRRVSFVLLHRTPRHAPLVTSTLNLRSVKPVWVWIACVCKANAS